MSKPKDKKYQDIDFQQVCNYLYEAIHVADGDGVVRFVNDAYTKSTGIRPEQILGRRVADIEAEGVLYKGSVTSRVLATKETVHSVATIYGLNKQVLVTGIPVFDDEGNVAWVITNTRDFTELKHLELQLLEMEEQQRRTNAEMEYLRSRTYGGARAVYRSDYMASVMELIQKIALTDANILITGESGTGKELVANEVYQNSDRKDKPFIKVNCAAIPSELLESELFGYEGGAFTGAKESGKPGLFELANTGVILLDEIGDLPLALQAKLLRVLQQREFLRVGGSKPIRLDVRLIAATNKDLQKEVEEGRFRKDLYYRLNVVPVELKPLRERKEDIPVLAESFCRRFSKKYDKRMVFSPDGLDQLVHYNWPGNIRELENLIERIVVTNPAETVIDGPRALAALNPGAISKAMVVDEGRSLKEHLASYERGLIEAAVEREGSLRKAAKVLGVDHSTLVKKYHNYQGKQEE